MLISAMTCWYRRHERIREREREREKGRERERERKRERERECVRESESERERERKRVNMKSAKPSTLQRTDDRAIAACARFHWRASLGADGPVRVDIC